MSNWPPAGRDAGHGSGVSTVNLIVNDSVKSAAEQSAGKLSEARELRKIAQ